MIINNRSHYSILKTRGVTVSVNPVAETPRDVYRVAQVYDLGTGEETAVLEHLGYYARGAVKRRSEPMCLPRKIDNLNLIYTGRKRLLAHDLNDLVEACPHENAIESIVPDVLAPGDLVIFKESPRDKNILIVDSLRIVKHKDVEVRTRMAQP